MNGQLKVSSNVHELSTVPISPQLHLATLGLTEIKLLKLFFSAKPLLGECRNMASISIWGTSKALSVVMQHVSDFFFVDIAVICTASGIINNTIINPNIKFVLTRSVIQL